MNKKKYGAHLKIHQKMHDRQKVHHSMQKMMQVSSKDTADDTRFMLRRIRTIRHKKETKRKEKEDVKKGYYQRYNSKARLRMVGGEPAEEEEVDRGLQHE